MVTPPVAQVAMWYGADDIDGTVAHYEITHALGATSHRQALSEADLLHLIAEARRDAVERDAFYNPVVSSEGLPHSDAARDTNDVEATAC